MSDSLIYTTPAAAAYRRLAKPLLRIRFTRRHRNGHRCFTVEFIYIDAELEERLCA
jgi:hypothetical protein